MKKSMTHKLQGIENGTVVTYLDYNLGSHLDL